MASNSYIHTTNSLPLKSNSSSQLYGATRGRNMGVLVTSPWPMSQPISPHTFNSSSKSSRDIHVQKECCESDIQWLTHRHGSIRSRHRSQSNIVRPLSMPPAFTMNRRNREASCCHETGIEMVPLNPHDNHPNIHPNVPCRASITAEINPISPPTCVPWLKKMKVIKKIQRRIGIGSRGGGISPNNMPPLLFHNVHGENVTISQNGSMARRTNSFCKAIAFSDRPVKIAEKVCIKFTEVATNWNGVLRIGFTSHDPTSLRNNLPRYACPDLTSRPGFWAKAFNDFFVKRDSVLFYYTTAAGDVHFGINGEEKAVFFSGVDTRGPLWAMLDIYGNTTCVEFVDPRAHLNNSRRCINDLASSSHEEVESSMIEILPSFNGLKLLDTTFPAIPYYLESDIEELHFHRVRGRNVMYTADTLPCIAIRRHGEYCNAYVFTARPVQPGETILIQILHSDDSYSSSMAFGLTACNPQSVCSDSLPEDAHLLLDRPEYWVVKKDIANNPKPKDVLAFSISLSGQVTMAVNGGPPVIQMHVDNSVPLWAFFDMYGTTDRIRIAGSIKPNSVQIQQQQQQQSFALKRPGTSTSSDSRGAGPCFSARAFSQSSLSQSFSMPSTSVAARELSQSPNSHSLKASLVTKGSYSAYESFASGSQSMLETSNWTVECVACCERPVDSVFYSCGHMAMCYVCAVEYWKSKEKGCCPICRAVISDIIRTYKS